MMCLSANVLFAAPYAVTFENPIIATGIQLSPVSLTEAALVFDLSLETPIETSVLDNPPRLILELPKVIFPSKQDILKATGPIQAYRYGWFVAGRSRVILDLDGPAIVERTDTIKTDSGMRMVVTIKRTDQQSFSLAVRENAANVRYTGTVKNTNIAQKQVFEAPKDQLPLVILDPGHGGLDSGAAGANGALEKNLVLKIGLMLKTKLEATGKMRVTMTRETDVFVPLADRVKIARVQSAALFVSLHADTLNNEPNVRGSTIYTLSDNASDVASEQLADKENKVDQLAGIEASDDKETLSDILFDLTRRETRVFSLDFAKMLVSYIQNAQAQGLTMIAKNPHRFARFAVLKAPDVPSVLFELGYLSSADDAKDLTSPEWQNKLTDAASEAIVKFVEGRGR